MYSKVVESSVLLLFEQSFIHQRKTKTLWPFPMLWLLFFRRVHSFSSSLLHYCLDLGFGALEGLCLHHSLQYLMLMYKKIIENVRSRTEEQTVRIIPAKGSDIRTIFYAFQKICNLNDNEIIKMQWLKSTFRLINRKINTCHNSTSERSSKNDVQSMAFSVKSRANESPWQMRNENYKPLSDDTWMKNVRHRWIVYDDSLSDFSVKQGQIFHVMS